MSVIIVNWNGEKVLTDCLNSVLNSDYHCLEVIVVDNASTDESVEMIEQQFHSSVKLIRLRKNMGFAVANNIGFLCSNGKYLVFLNNDTIVDRNCLKELVKVMEENCNVGAAQAMLLSIDGTHIDSGGDFIDKYGYPFTRAHGVYYTGQFSDVYEIFSAKAAAMIIRTTLFKKLGMFNDAFFVGFEDVDLGWMVWLYGYRVLYVPTAVVRHIGEYSVRKVKGSILNPNLFMIISKNFQILNFLRALPLMTLVYLVALIINLIRNPRDAFFYMKNMFHIINMLTKGLRSRSAIQSLRKVSDRELLKTRVIYDGSIFILIIATKRYKYREYILTNILQRF